MYGFVSLALCVHMHWTQWPTNLIETIYIHSHSHTGHNLNGVCVCMSNNKFSLAQSNNLIIEIVHVIELIAVMPPRREKKMVEPNVARTHSLNSTQNCFNLLNFSPNTAFWKATHQKNCLFSLIRSVFLFVSFHFALLFVATMWNLEPNQVAAPCSHKKTMSNFIAIRFFALLVKMEMELRNMEKCWWKLMKNDCIAWKSNGNERWVEAQI